MEEKRKRRSKSQAEWQSDPKKNKLIVQYAQTGSLTKAAKAADVPYGTATSWTADTRFHIALQRILNERGGGLHKAAKVIDEAMSADRTRIDKNGNVIEEVDHKVRLQAARMVLEVHNAFPSKNVKEDGDTGEDLFEDVVVDEEKDEEKKEEV